MTVGVENSTLSNSLRTADVDRPPLNRASTSDTVDEMTVGVFNTDGDLVDTVTVSIEYPAVMSLAGSVGYVRKCRPLLKIHLEGHMCV